MSVEDEIKEQLKAEGITPEEPKAEEQNEEQYTEFEQEQMKKGWKPGGEKSAEEFARAEPLYNELKARGKEIKDLKRTVEEMAEFMRKQEKHAYEKALKELSAQRYEAIQRGDVALVDKLDEERNQLSHTPITPAAVPVAVQDFTEKYSVILQPATYEQSKIGDWVRRRDNELSSRGLDPDAHMKLLETEMLERFSDFFGSNKSTSAVESGQGGNVVGKTSSKKLPSFNELTSEQKQAARDFVAYGTFKNTDEYIKKLVELGEIK